jgi:hypothetical protein
VGELLGVRERIAARLIGAVVDRNRGFDPADLKACLTKRVLAQQPA